jgi:hypothetical protein
MFTNGAFRQNMGASSWTVLKREIQPGRAFAHCFEAGRASGYIQSDQQTTRESVQPETSTRASESFGRNYNPPKQITKKLLLLELALLTLSQNSSSELKRIDSTKACGVRSETTTRLLVVLDPPVQTMAIQTSEH